MAKVKSVGNGLSSAGHRIGQIVGDWWEKSVVYPMLKNIADESGLFLDNRMVERNFRGGHVQWPDSDGNTVDYDFVLELNGSQEASGIPVAFFESFWRGGARHSKDKARDDTNKLLPMRETYATAKFLAIAACGEFTEPAREYVRSRSVELLFIPKSNIVAAFEMEGLTIEYPDALPEAHKSELVNQLVQHFNGKLESKVADNLQTIAGATTFRSFEKRVMGALCATPQEIRIKSVHMSQPRAFTSLDQATNFLEQPSFSFEGGEKCFTYEVTYSDGSEFARTLPTVDAVRKMHDELARLVIHMSQLAARERT